MTAKYLLTRFTVDRPDETGKKRRRTLPANSTQRLTADEIELLDKLTKSTGRIHYREPRNESAVEDDTFDTDPGGFPGFVDRSNPDGVQGGGAEDADGNDSDDLSAQAELANTLADIAGMTVKELKQFLDAEPAVEYAASDDKATLMGKAESKAKAAADPDGGL